MPSDTQRAPSEAVQFQQTADRLKAELTLIGEDVVRAMIDTGLLPLRCEALIVAIAKRVQAAEAGTSELERIADQAWTCVELDKRNDTPFNEAFDQLAKLCVGYQPRCADPILVAFADTPTQGASHE